MKQILASFALFFSLAGQAQNSFVGADLSYSTYDMTQMKTLQQNFITQSGLQMHAVTTFPAWWGYGLSWGSRTTERGSFAGVSLNYNSTGGRVDYEDYSGTARMDQLFTSYSLGGFYQAILNRSDKWPFFLSFTGSWISTHLTMSESISVTGQSSSETHDFYSHNFGFRPSFVLRRNFNRVFAQAGLGYEFQLTGKLYLKDNKQAYLTDGGGGNATAQWNGLRATIGIGVLFHKRPPDGK